MRQPPPCSSHQTPPLRVHNNSNNNNNNDHQSTNKAVHRSTDTTARNSSSSSGARLPIHWIRVRRCSILLLVTAATQIATTATAATATEAATAVDVNAGRIVFEQHCAVCHAGGQNKFNPQRTLHQSSLEKFLPGGGGSSSSGGSGSSSSSSNVVTVSNVQSFVQNSVLHRGKFVLGETKLSETEYQNVAAYVVEQASGNKWE